MNIDGCGGILVNIKLLNGVPLMKKWRSGKYTFDTFFFDEKKEKAIYDYLCKKKLNRKLLIDEVKFESFHSWEQYIVNRYEAYSKASLIEFSKFLNWSLREAKKYDNSFKEVFVIFLSGAFGAAINDFFSSKFENITAFFVAVVSLLSLLIYGIMLLIRNGERENIYFYEDVKDIIDKMIKER